jgi:tetratricopeptide (TPR) repeat protein
VRAYDGLGVAYSLLPDLTKSEATFQRLVEYAENAGRPSAKVTALNRLALTAAMLGGDLAAAHRYLEDAYSVAKEADDEFGLAEYHLIACTVAAMGGDVETSLAHNGQIARWGEVLGADRIRAEGLTRMAMNQAWLMDFDRIGSTLKEARSAALAAKDERNLAVLEAMVEYRLRLREGDVGAALDAMLKSEEALVRYDEFLLPLIWVSAATLLWCRGDLEPALHYIERARESAAARGMTYFTAAACATSAWIYATLGLAEEAEVIRRRAIEDVRSPIGGFVSSTVWADLGFAALALGDMEGAADAFEEELGASSATKFWEMPRLLVGHALVQAANGEVAEAHASLDEAERFLREKEVRVFDAHLAHGRAEVLIAEGKPDEAAVRLAEALEAAEAAGWRVFSVQLAASAAALAEKRGDQAEARRCLELIRREVDAMASAVQDPTLSQALRAALAGPLVAS